MARFLGLLLRGPLPFPRMARFLFFLRFRLHLIPALPCLQRFIAFVMARTLDLLLVRLGLDFRFLFLLQLAPLLPFAHFRDCLFRFRFMVRIVGPLLFLFRRFCTFLGLLLLFRRFPFPLPTVLLARLLDLLREGFFLPPLRLLGRRPPPLLFRRLLVPRTAKVVVFGTLGGAITRGAGGVITMGAGDETTIGTCTGAGVGTGAGSDVTTDPSPGSGSSAMTGTPGSGTSGETGEAGSGISGPWVCLGLRPWPGVLTLGIG